MNTLKIWLVSCALLLVGAATWAQESLPEEERMKRMQQEELKIEQYINEHLSVPIPQKIIDDYLHSLDEEKDAHGHTLLNDGDKQLHVEKLKFGYWRTQYFIEFPDRIDIYLSTPVSGCTNGDFELGNFTGYTLASGNNTSGNGYVNGECTFIPLGPVTTLTPEMPFANTDNFDIVGPGTDPYVPIQQINPAAGLGDNWAVRINGGKPLANPITTSCWPDRGVNRLSRTVVLTSTGISEIGFYYALVMEYPNHPNQNPFFVARAMNAAGTELDRVCRISNPGDPFFNTVAAHTYMGCSISQTVYSDWTCGELEVTGNVGDTITLEFYAVDCGQGAHFSYAYLDDICEPCVADTCNFQGSIDLDYNDDTCFVDSFKVCGSYELAAINCTTATVTSITLNVIQGGVSTAVTVVPTIDLVNQTFCFMLAASDFPSATGGYDFEVTITFNINGAAHTETDVHTIPGQDNDVNFECCPEFEVVDCCTYWYGGGESESDAQLSYSDSLIQALVQEYKDRINAKRDQEFLSYGAEDDPPCDPCSFPGDTFPIFILDENGVLISDSYYQITWSHRPGWTAAYSYILPGDSTTVIVSDTVTGCSDTLVFVYHCCPPIEINLLCVSCEPCEDPEIPFLLNVLDSNGNALSAATHTFNWSTGSTGSAISGYVNTVYWVEVTDSNGCTQTDTFIIECCIPNIPINLKCSNYGNGMMLTWDPVIGADHYIIEVIHGDPACCFGGSGAFGVMYISDTNQLFISGISCGSWRVYAVCPDGRWSVASAKKCLCPWIIKWPCVYDYPYNRYCDVYPNFVKLSWDTVPGVTEYEVVVYDDQACCGVGSGSPTYYTVHADNLTLPRGTCGSWSIRSKCPDQVYSSFSPISCMCASGSQGLAPMPDDNLVPEENESDESYQLHNLTVEAHPNPSSGIVEFLVESPLEDQHGNIVLVRLDGTIAIEFEVPVNQAVRRDLSELGEGSFLYYFESGEYRSVSRKLIIRP